MRADRLLRLLMLLQRHRKVTAAWLAAELEVSERTVLRDMEALSAAGVPVYTEQGRGGGCVLLDDFTTKASGLTPAEAQALFAWASRESTRRSRSGRATPLCPGQDRRHCTQSGAGRRRRPRAGRARRPAALVR